jgi:hypothetical protein
MKKILLSIALFLGGISASNAQFEISNLSVGAGYAPSMYFGSGLGTMTSSFSGKLQYEQDESFFFADGIFSNKDFSDDPSGTKISFMHLNAGYGRYLVGDADEDLNVAGKVGAGLSSYSLTADNLVEAQEDATWSMNASVVANFSVSDAIKLFGEAGAIFSAGTYNSQGNGTASPEFNCLVFQVGARFRFQ